jgi:8-oxo-dGTP pyrophosphatase MutT (NUDIX family)
MLVVNVEGAVERNGRYLMIVRGPNVSHAPGALSFPGGKVEPADGPVNALESAVRREIREEVAVEIDKSLTYIESRLFDLDDGRKALNVVFLCRYKSGIPDADSDEVESVSWITPDQILAEAPPWFRATKMQLIEDMRRREDLRRG